MKQVNSPEKLVQLVEELSAKCLSLEEALAQSNLIRELEEKDLMKQAECSSLLLELIMQAPTLSDQDLLDKALDIAFSATGSRAGFICQISDDQQEIIPMAWKGRTGESSLALDVGHLSIECAGIWAECFQLRQAVVNNDWRMEQGREGSLPGHQPIERWIGIPVIQEGKARLILGVANKPVDYADSDVRRVQYVADALHRLLLRREEESSLSKISDRWQYAVQGSRDGLLDWNIQTNQVYYSDRWPEMLGYRPEEINGRPEDWLSRIHPEDLPLAQEAAQRHLNGEADQFISEHRLRCKDGSWKWVLARGKVTEWDSQGKPLRMVSTETDLSDRKAAEEKISGQYSLIRSILDTTPGFLVLKDREGIYREVNPAFCEFLNKPYEEIIGKTDWELFPPEEAAAYIKGDREVMGTGIPEREDWLVPGGKESRWLLVIKNAVLNESGECIGVLCSVTDVSARKQAEETIRKSAEKFRIVADNAFNWELWEGADGQWIHHSPSCKRITGYSSEELMEDPGLFFRIIHPDDLAEYIGHHNEMSLRQGPGKHAFRILTKEGEIRHIDHYCSPVYDDDHVFLGIRGSNVDVTERIQAEEQLRESEVQYRNLANAGSALIWTSGKDKLCNYFNDSWLIFTGRTLDQETGNGWAEGVHPEDFDRCLETYVTAFDKQEPFEMEYRLRHASGEYKWILDLGKPNFNAAGEFVGYLGHCFDITERKLTESTQAFLFGCGLPGTGEDFFESLAKYLSSALNMEYVCIDKLQGDGLIAETLAVFNQGTIEPNTEYALKDTPCGEVVDKSVCFYRSGVRHLFPNDTALQELNAESYVGTTLLDSKGKAIGLIAVIGFQPCQEPGKAERLLKLVAPRAAGELERRQAERTLQLALDQLMEAKAKAEESDRLKTAFLANMSHEIRTPMNGILGFSELLKDPDLTGEQQLEYIRIIEKSGERMLNIINDLVDISKIEAGLMTIKLSETKITQLIDYLHAFFMPELEGKSRKLICSYPLSEKELVLLTDHDKLYAILSNLVKNSIKYSDAGDIIIGFTVRGDSIRFFVKDSGIGIPKDRQQEIFERFVQAHAENRKVRQGAGLGLSIARSYVEMLGGKIWVESEPGVGSTFYFTLPYPANPQEGTRNPAAVSIDTDSISTNLRILIAEDDDVSEMLLNLEMKPFCKEILKARTGKEAVALCRENPDIDLILMDIRMPEMDGYDAIRQIRMFNKAVVIFAQTAFGLSGDQRKSIEAGSNEYLTKPLKKNDLLTAIRRYFPK